MKDTTIRQEIQQTVIADNRHIEAVVGLDLGDKNSWMTRLELNGSESLSCSIHTSPSALTKYFSKQKRLRVVIEAGSHSNWIAQLLERLGHEVIVAHPRQLKLISVSPSKNDRRDAGLLAELGLTSPKLLAPTQPRSHQTLTDRCTLVSRQVLVGARTKLINSVRGQMKIFGLRVSQGDASSFAARARAELPKDLRTALGALLTIIGQLSGQIKRMDQRVQRLAETRYRETAWMRQIQGVGPTTSLAFALALDNDPARLRKSRDAGAFVGLRPKQRESGSRSPELGISRIGDRTLRCLLVPCAHYVLGRHGEDSALRRWGLKLAGRGGKNAKKRAIVAVARKLAVLMHLLWSRGEVYDPFYGVERPVERPEAQAAA